MLCSGVEGCSIENPASKFLASTPKKDWNKPESKHWKPGL